MIIFAKKINAIFNQIMSIKYNENDNIDALKDIHTCISENHDMFYRTCRIHKCAHMVILQRDPTINNQPLSTKKYAEAIIKHLEIIDEVIEQWSKQSDEYSLKLLDKDIKTTIKTCKDYAK